MSTRLPANGCPQRKDSLAEEEEETDVDTKSMLTEVLCRTVMGSPSQDLRRMSGTILMTKMIMYSVYSLVCVVYVYIFTHI